MGTAFFYDSTRSVIVRDFSTTLTGREIAANRRGSFVRKATR